MGLKHRRGYGLNNDSEEIERFLEEFAEPSQEQVLDGHVCVPAQARSRIHRYLDGLLWAATFGVMAVMVLRMTPNGLDGKRYIPLIVAFVPWMAVLSAAILLISLISRRRVLAVISVLCLVMQLVWHAGFLSPRVSLSSAARMAVTSVTASVDDRYARLMTLNTRNGQADAAQIVQTVREQHVEVLALQELNSSMISRLNEAGIRELLPYSVVASTSSSDNGGVNGLWSAAPMSERTGDLIPIEASSIPAASIDFDGTVIRFGSVHPFSPRPSNQGLWDRGLGSISQLGEDDHTFVLMGDFNATWDHASFRYLLGGRFVDAGENAGEWFHMTYPANKRLFGWIPVPAAVEIDHIVHDRSVVVGDLDAVTVSGSDHKALLGTLEVR